jgi:ribonuclease E
MPSKSITSKILINAIDPEECRIAKITNNKLSEFQLETPSRTSTQGNIYKAVITRVEPSLQAVFVDYGTERHGFLQKQEIHSDYYQDTDGGERSLSNIIKRGQELIVQVTKDPIMKKGAMLTTYISLAGRYIVLMPGSNNHGVSRKIEEEEERQRLKDMIGTLKVPEGYGLIVRTAGKNATKTALSNDLRYLMRIWKNINQKVEKEKAPALLHVERPLVVRAIRDYLTPDVSEILIDDVSIHKEIKNFMSIISPKQTKIVKLYKGVKPIFTKYQLENQIESIFKNRVTLKSGGSIVIDPTEALVAIDVNSGKATSKKNVEETALQTNLEAAEEVARQLRLRDLGGLVVIDFIDMREARHKLEIERAMKTHVKADKARTKVGKISRFGLLEMSRQRIRPSIEQGHSVRCKYCKGRGLVPSTESLGLSFLRKLSLETLKPEVTGLTGIVPQDVAVYLLNKKKVEILDIETRRNVSITITGDASMVPGDSKIICVCAESDSA